MFWLLLIALLLLAGIIFFLHRSQEKNRNDVADRTAPLATPDLKFTHQDPAAQEAQDGGFSNPADAHQNPENWLEQVKQLREQADLAGALRLSQQHYPRIQAFQQAAVILRQIIRESIEQHRPVVAELRQLYRIAVLADLYRNSNPHKPKDPLATFNALQSLEFDYKSIGTRLLRILTKSDIRHLEQLWGKPQSHQHAEETLSLRWQELCQ